MDSLVREVQVAAEGIRLYLDWRRLGTDHWTVMEAEFLCCPCVTRRLGLARPPLHRVSLPDGVFFLVPEAFVLSLQSVEHGAFVRKDAILVGHLCLCRPHSRILLSPPISHKAPS